MEGVQLKGSKAAARHQIAALAAGRGGAGAGAEAGEGEQDSEGSREEEEEDGVFEQMMDNVQGMDESVQSRTALGEFDFVCVCTPPPQPSRLKVPQAPS
eukprot:3941116-Rhodomonas_salina.1